MNMAVAAATHVGRVRERNEDHVVVGGRSLTGPQDAHAEVRTEPFLMGVLDGMGGHPAGDLASGLAAEVLTTSAPPSNEREVEDIVAVMQQAIHERMESDPSTTAMGTTLVFASVLGPDRALVAGVGDSSALWYAQDDLHSIIGTDRSRGGLITQCIGGTRSRAEVTPHVVEVDGPGRLLLCTDGLTDVLAPGQVADTLREHSSPADAVTALVDQAVRGGGQDNVTVVLVDLGDPG